MRIPATVTAVTSPIGTVTLPVGTTLQVSFSPTCRLFASSTFQADAATGTRPGAQGRLATLQACETNRCVPTAFICGALRELVAEHIPGNRKEGFAATATGLAPY